MVSASVVHLHGTQEVTQEVDYYKKLTGLFFSFIILCSIKKLLYFC